MLDALTRREDTGMDKQVSVSRIYQGDDPAALMDAALRAAAGFMCLRRDEGAAPCLACSACKKVLTRAHTDVRVIDGGAEGAVKIDDIRALRADLFVRPFDSDCKINIIAHAETLNTAAQNALLTVLEEPPPYASFLLLTRNARALLPTVRSRCALIRLPPAPEPPPAPEDTQRAERYLRAVFSGDGWEIAGAALSLEKLPRDELSRVLRAGLVYLEKAFFAGTSPQRAMALCETFLKLLDALEGNASPGSVCGVLMLGG